MISNRAIDEPRPLKVIYIGAGVSGIIAAIEFRKALPSVDLVIYEKNPEVGGTWYENRYPGCACDIPSHAYQLSFESSTEWTQFYSGAPEILDYWKKVVEKYRVRELVNFNHQCTEATWDEANSLWKVKLLKLDGSSPRYIEDEADVLITGTGTLNEWKWPRIDCLHDFKGTLLHTANWDDTFDPTDKAIAVIGAGSSGIQVVPALLEKVKSMDHYVRGKTWISTQFNQDVLDKMNTVDGYNNLTNFSYTPEERQAWKKNRHDYIKYRKGLEFTLQSNYGITVMGGEKSTKAQALYEKNMRQRLSQRPDIGDHLIPNFPPLCKRITPGPGYLEALTDSRVTLVTSPIARAFPGGLETVDGIKREVDAIICATGFETSPSAGFPIYGRDGINLRTKYQYRPKTYLGLCTDNFPNFFQSLGPNSFQGAGSLLIQMEYTHRYIAQILQKMAISCIKSIEPKRKQVENFTRYCDKYFEKTVYKAECVSWYKTNDRVTALWPGSSVHALHALRSVRWEDFDIEYLDEGDFGWFGNGCAMADDDLKRANDESLVWYLSNSQFLHEPTIAQQDPSPNVSEILTTSGPTSCDGNLSNSTESITTSSLKGLESSQHVLLTEDQDTESPISAATEANSTHIPDTISHPYADTFSAPKFINGALVTKWPQPDTSLYPSKNSHLVVLEELQQKA